VLGRFAQYKFCQITNNATNTINVVDFVFFILFALIYCYSFRCKLHFTSKKTRHSFYAGWLLLGISAYDGLALFDLDIQAGQVNSLDIL